MPTATTDCFCGLSQLDVLKLIFEQNQDIFDRLGQINQTISTSGSEGVGGFSSAPDIIVAVAGTAVQGSNVPAARGVLIVADPNNTGIVYVGDSGVTNGSGSERGLILSQAGMPSQILPIDNVNRLFVNADNAGDRVGVVLM